jgi:hypothetical protein
MSPLFGSRLLLLCLCQVAHRTIPCESTAALFHHCRNTLINTHAAPLSPASKQQLYWQEEIEIGDTRRAEICLSPRVCVCGCMRACVCVRVRVCECVPERCVCVCGGGEGGSYAQCAHAHKNRKIACARAHAYACVGHDRSTSSSSSSFTT